MVTGRADIVYAIGAQNKTSGAFKSVRSDVDKTGGRVGGLAGRFGGLGKAIGGVATVAAGLFLARGAGAILGKASAFLETGDALDKMNQRLGISVETLSAWSFAAQQSGTDLETLDKAILKQSRLVTDASEGNQTAIDTLKLLGLQYSDLEGLSPEDTFRRITEALGGIEDPTRRAAAAQEAFGRSGAAILPLAGNLEDLEEQARRTGNVMSTETAQAAARFNDVINTTKNRVSGLALQGFGFLLPHMEAAARFTDRNLTPAMRTIGSIIKTVTADGRGFAIALAAVGAAAYATVPAIVAKTVAVSASAVAWLAANAASGGTLLLIGAIATAAIILLPKLWDMVGGLEGISGAFGRVKDAGQEGLERLVTFGERFLPLFGPAGQLVVALFGFRDNVGGILAGIQGFFSNLDRNVRGIINGIIGAVEGAVNAAGSAVNSLAEGAQGIVARLNPFGGGGPAIPSIAAVSLGRVSGTGTAPTVVNQYTSNFYGDVYGQEDFDAAVGQSSQRNDRRGLGPFSDFEG